VRQAGGGFPEGDEGQADGGGLGVDQATSGFQEGSFHREVMDFLMAPVR
jgi:hypothetical protein